MLNPKSMMNPNLPQFVPGQAQNQEQMNPMFSANPALLYQNQLMYQALQDPATVAYLIQQQQLLQQQLQAQHAAQAQNAAMGRQIWAQRSQQIYGATKNDKLRRENRPKVVKAKPVKMRPDEGEMILPDVETQQAIIEAAEFYFSDENLAKDHYLLRQICQKSEGFLSIKLLTALKNVKKITKDWRVTAHCLKQSKHLQLNDEQTKVRRIAALPEHVLKARTITNVLCIKMPKTLGSVGAVTAMFAEFGNISLVRVLLEGKPVPCDLRNYATQVPDMGTNLCAVVEFETEEEATRCVKELNARQTDTGMRSALLGPRLRRNLYKIQSEEEKEAELVKMVSGVRVNPDEDSGCDSGHCADDADVSGVTSDASSTHETQQRNKQLRKRKDRASDDILSMTSSEDYTWSSGKSEKPWSKTVEGTTNSSEESENTPYRIRQLSVIREPRGPESTAVKGFEGVWKRKAEPIKC